MKKVLKNLFSILFICIISISLTACGNNKIDNNVDDIINQSENNNKKNDNNDNKTEEDEYDYIKLYSDDTKIVFNMEDIYYLVFYHNGNEITGLEYVYDYPDKETAKFFESTWRASYEAEENVEKVELKGNQLIIKFKKAAYEGQTLESIKQTYSYLEELKKN